MFTFVLILGMAAYQFACSDMLLAFDIPILSHCKCVYEVRDVAIINPYRAKVYYPIIKSFIKSIEYEDRHSPQFELEHIVPAHFDTTDFLIEDIVGHGKSNSVTVYAQMPMRETKEKRKTMFFIDKKIEKVKHYY